jgi:hypothetical protein
MAPEVPLGMPPGMPLGMPPGLPPGMPLGMPPGPSVGMPLGQPLGMPPGPSVGMPLGLPPGLSGLHPRCCSAPLCVPPLSALLPRSSAVRAPVWIPPLFSLQCRFFAPVSRLLLVLVQCPVLLFAVGLPLRSRVQSVPLALQP